MTSDRNAPRSEFLILDTKMAAPTGSLADRNGIRAALEASGGLSLQSAATAAVQTNPRVLAAGDNIN